MNKSSPDLAAHYAHMGTLRIPRSWSPEQALAAWELIDDIAGMIWDHYELQLIELIQDDRRQHDPDQLDLFDPDDPFPF